MLLLHTQTLFCSASEFAVCLIQDLWWHLPPAPPSASMPQFLLFPGKFEIMASLKVHSSFQLSSHALSGGSMSVEIFFFLKAVEISLWMSVKVSPRSRLSSLFFTPQGFSNFIDKLTPNPCCMEITDKSSTPDPDTRMETPFYLRPTPNQNLGLFLRNFFSNLCLSLSAQAG